MRPLLSKCFCVIAGCWWFFHSSSADAEPPAVLPTSGVRSEAVARQAVAILQTRCTGCHGADAKEIQGKLDLRSRAAMLKGGESGKPTVIPGKPAESLLFQAVSRSDPQRAMPPKENDRLSADEVAIIRDWIQSGAAWPISVTTNSKATDWNQREYQAEDVWAFQPIQNPPVPVIKNVPDLHPIDAFLRQSQLRAGLPGSAPRAEWTTLIRRVFLDLTGITPTPTELARWTKGDAARTTYGPLVEHLLASPHYGEQMTRHWLDVVRYADTSGFSNDFERPNAWRYRDYVVRSFNDDKPFDRFAQEQIAGDELDSQNPEMAIATGFLRMGPWEHTGMSVSAVTRQQFLDDAVNHVGVVFLGLPLRCAACHDHKFDPIPTADYYRVQAVFAATQFTERPLPFLERENSRACETAKERALQRITEVEQAKTALKRRSDDALAAYLKEKGVTKVEDLPVSERPKKDYLGYKTGLSDQELTLRKVFQKRSEYLNRELRRYQPWVFTIYTGPTNSYQSNNLSNPIPALKEFAAPRINVLIGGSLESPGEVVTPGVLSAVFGSNDSTAPTDWNHLPVTAAGRRLGFARWVGSRDNTLTARVIVNRVWQWHFGRGLVETSNNFGKMGSKPSHPELLDWLATWFIEHGWSLKKLHRLIMTSDAYQQATELVPREQTARLEQLDPKNRWLARFTPRRLAAEEIRDALLAATGELNRDVGGPGIFPEIAWEDALQPRHVMGSVAPAYQPSPTPAERNRRTLYAFKFRTLPDPLLATFNQPASEISCERRDETTVAPQALALFNGPFVHDRALALAARLHQQQTSLTARIDAAFQTLYLRAPDDPERKTCEQHIQKMLAIHTKRSAERDEPPRLVKRRMVEELTGTEIEWDEELDLLRNYQPDLKPWDVAPEVRALADLCLVLMNSNEFIYVR